jgi:hypothetical protein
MGIAFSVPGSHLTPILKSLDPLKSDKPAFFISDPRTLCHGCASPPPYPISRAREKFEYQIALQTIGHYDSCIVKVENETLTADHSGKCRIVSRASDLEIESRFNEKVTTFPKAV